MKKSLKGYYKTSIYIGKGDPTVDCLSYYITKSEFRAPTGDFYEASMPVCGLEGRSFGQVSMSMSLDGVENDRSLPDKVKEKVQRFLDHPEEFIFKPMTIIKNS